MTRLLEKAFDEASKLPPEDQDSLAAELLDALANEEKWAGALERVPDALAELADEALREHRAGRTDMIWFWIGSHADYDRLLSQR